MRDRFDLVVLLAASALAGGIDMAMAWRAVGLARLPTDSMLPLLSVLGTTVGLAILVALVFRGLAIPLITRAPEPAEVLQRAAVPAGLASVVALHIVDWMQAPLGDLQTMGIVGGGLAFVAILGGAHQLGVVAIALVAVGLPLRNLDRVMQPPSNGHGQGPDIVLVTLDTLRADHIGAIGGFGREVKTPHLDALAERGLLFEHGTAPVPLTLPAHVSMLAGQPPYLAGVVRNGDLLPETSNMVAQDLLEAGYHTGAFVSATVLRRDSGIHRGFQHYDDLMRVQDARMESGLFQGLWRLGLADGREVERQGGPTVDRAIAWWNNTPSPRFLWVHLYDPHYHYEPPAPFDTMYDGSAPDAPGHDVVLPTEEVEYENFALPESMAEAMALYAGEVSYTDAEVGRLLQATGEVPVVVAADHGESLFEHDYFINHGAFLYEPSLRVPMIAAGPGIAVGERVSTPTAAWHVADTLRRFAGLIDQGGLGDAGAQEVVAYAPAQDARITMGTDRPVRVAFRFGQEKWIIDDTDVVEHYNLSLDPDEQDPAPTDESRAAAFLTRGQEMIKALEERDFSAVGSGASDDLEALRALGYIE